jgi:hypothetical protein
MLRAISIHGYQKILCDSPSKSARQGFFNALGMDEGFSMSLSVIEFAVLFTDYTWSKRENHALIPLSHIVSEFSIFESLRVIFPEVCFD